MITESGWGKYPLVPAVQGEDEILVHTLADRPDFSNLDALTRQIEEKTLAFTADVERFLSGLPQPL